MDRDEKGKFTTGNGGGPGRPPKEREERFLSITLTAVTYKDWEDIVKKAVKQAKGGDNMARKFLADYIMGPPTQKTELSGKDGGPIPVEMFEKAVAKVYDTG